MAEIGMIAVAACVWFCAAKLINKGMASAGYKGMPKSPYDEH